MVVLTEVNNRHNADIGITNRIESLLYSRGLYTRKPNKAICDALRNISYSRLDNPCMGSKKHGSPATE